MRKIYLILGGAISFIILLIIIAIIIIVLRLPEDDWIIDERGVWIAHGNPSSVPIQVTSQKDAIACAADLYANYPKEEILSQCLGRCWDYSVDFVSVPRKEVDNKIENQCEDYRLRNTHHFIELDNEGSIVRII